MILAAAAILALNAVAEPPRRSPAGAPSPAAVDWLKLYPLSPYREFWTAEIEVKSLADDLPRVIEVLEKAGGDPTVPLANTIGSQSAGTQQLSYRFSKKNAEAALKRLRKVGKVPSPRVRPAGDLIPMPEIKRKIEELSRDKQAHGVELASMPAVSALVEAMLGHLLTVQSIGEKVEQEVVLNLTLRQGPR